MTQKPKFAVGQSVKVAAYTDCFNVFHPETEPLIVSEIRLMEPYPLMGGVPPYYRIRADASKGLGFHEAAERFFIADETPKPPATPRGKHSHRCMTCGEAVYCYKSQCTKPQRVEVCQWCKPVGLPR